MNDNSLSKKAHEELKEQLNKLKSVKRKAISKAIKDAAEHGDLKENSAYHEARKEQSLNEARIADLEHKLSIAKVVENKKAVSGSVAMGSTVEIKNITSKEKFKYTLVSELEANILEDKISMSSPLGKALLHHKMNEIVEFDAPLGVMKYKIVKIS